MAGFAGSLCVRWCTFTTIRHIFQKGIINDKLGGITDIALALMISVAVERAPLLQLMKLH